MKLESHAAGDAAVIIAALYVALVVDKEISKAFWELEYRIVMVISAIGLFLPAPVLLADAILLLGAFELEGAYAWIALVMNTVAIAAQLFFLISAWSKNNSGKPRDFKPTPVYLLSLLRGTLTLTFGVIALVSPFTTVVTLLWVFGLFAILEGIVAILIGVRSWRGSLGILTIFQGVVSMLAGGVALAWPEPTALTLLLVIAVWAIVLGIGEIGGAFAGRQKGSTAAWYWILLAGVLNAVFGVVLILIWLASGIPASVWLVGIFVVGGGIVLMVFGVRCASSRESAVFSVW